MTTESLPDFPYCSADAKLAESVSLPGGNLVSREGEPSFLAADSNLWWPKGKKLKVRFLNGTPKLKQKVRDYSQIWERYANIDFRFVEDGDADIRVSFKWPNPLYPKALDLGTWSQVGKRAQVAVPDQSQPTMNYGSLTDDSRESEFCRSIVHEFGHAIGCVHEHQAWKIDWNVPRVESDCLARYGWDKGTTQKQIINTWESINSLERSDFDANSIMCYYYPAEWTNDHTSAPTNLKLSATDRSFIGRIYPFQTRDQGELSIDPEIRTGYPLTALNSKAVSFVPPYHDVPRIAVGLKSLDIGNSGHIRIRAQAVEVTEDEFVVNVDTWMDTQLFNATATWIEFGPEDSDYQVGEFNTRSSQPPQPDENEVRRYRKHFSFSSGTYSEPPNVVVWLSALDIDKSRNYRVRALARNCTATGFDLDIESWLDTILYSATASWVAYPKNSDSAVSGRVSTLDVRTWFPAIPENHKEVTFPAKFFDKVPKLFVGISEIDMDSSANLRVKTYADSLSQDGFVWHGDTWLDSQLYAVSADWIAFG
ncbi:unnamed protein product [Clonostachys rhizophaga]|uniref:H-type lectin domain-containing protein n=1 Tax=Clonostachys rhizophaga TaxID=160324 RepID=A0A9N9YTC1_9HYPO|nr:unnamed protein product [Clonostachys rhizophaga]